MTLLGSSTKCKFCIPKLNEFGNYVCVNCCLSVLDDNVIRFFELLGLNNLDQPQKIEFESFTNTKETRTICKKCNHVHQKNDVCDFYLESHHYCICKATQELRISNNKGITDVDTKCPYCDDNLRAVWVGVVVIYEDGEWDKFCDYACFQRKMVKTWEDEIRSVMILEVDKI